MMALSRGRGKDWTGWKGFVSVSIYDRCTCVSLRIYIHTHTFSRVSRLGSDGQQLCTIRLCRIPILRRHSYRNFSTSLTLAIASSNVLIYREHHIRLPSLQEALPGELDLARRLAFTEPAAGDADALTVGQLELFLVRVPGAGAVVRETDAGEGIGAEVLVARRVLVVVDVVGCVAGIVLLPLVLLLLVLVAAALLAKHLVKEAAELGVGDGEEGEEGDEVAHRGDLLRKSCTVTRIHRNKKENFGNRMVRE